MNGLMSGLYILLSISIVEMYLIFIGLYYYIDLVFVCEDQQLNNIVNIYLYIKFNLMFYFS